MSEIPLPASPYAGRSVFVTGHTGFKGSWLSLWLASLGATIHGYALDPPTTPSLFELANVRSRLASHRQADIRDAAALESAIAASRPEMVFHLAARTVVREGYIDPVGAFDVNVRGTAVLLDALRGAGRAVSVVVVTSDKCYRNDGRGRTFREDDALGGDDPYSASKAGQELVAAAFRTSYFPPAALDRHGVGIATARAGNVVGGGDWTPDGLIADLVRARGADRPLELRYPSAIRPWQHVLEPLSGYLALGERLLTGDAGAAEAWNFGPDPGDEATVREVVERCLAAFGSGRWLDTSDGDHPHEASVLRLDAAKAIERLGWRPRWRLDETIGRTVEWYRQVEADPGAAADACAADISAYEAARSTRLPDGGR
jgi:CDP-glucose 4,6-dehydratase